MGRWLAPAALLLALVAGLGLVMARSARRGAFADPGSTYRAAPDGTRGLYLLARAAGLTVRRRHLDLQVLEHLKTLVLLDVPGPLACGDGAVAPAFGPGGGITPTECRTLLDWVAAGGNLVDVVRQDDALLGEVGLRFRDPDQGAPGSVEAPAVTGPGARADGAARDADGGVADGGTPDGGAGGGLPDGGTADAFPFDPFAPAPRRDLGPPRTLVPGQPSALVRGVGRVVTPVAGWLYRPDGKEVRLLVAPDPKAPAGAAAPAVAVAVPHGDGWVVAVAAPDLATNAFLGKADDADFWVSTLGALAHGGPVDFDEYHHGHAGDRTLLGYARDRGLFPALLQVLLVLLVAALAGRRLGPPARLEDAPQGTGADFLAAMSRLYQVGRHGAHAGEAIARRALGLARRHRRRPAVAEAARPLAAARARLHADAEAGHDTTSALAEVARRAAALYHALSQRPARRRGKRRHPRAASDGDDT